jgi:hypothetical protein
VPTRVLRFLGASSETMVVRTRLTAATFSRLTGGGRRGQEDRTSLFRRGVA